MGVRRKKRRGSVRRASVTAGAGKTLHACLPAGQRPAAFLRLNSHSGPPFPADEKPGGSPKRLPPGRTDFIAAYPVVGAHSQSYAFQEPSNTICAV